MNARTKVAIHLFHQTFVRMSMMIKSKKRGAYILKDRIKKIRKALDLTQQEFADRIGVKRNTVGQWECGINPFNRSDHFFYLPRI